MIRTSSEMLFNWQSIEHVQINPSIKIFKIELHEVENSFLSGFFVLFQGLGNI